MRRCGSSDVCPPGATTTAPALNFDVRTERTEGRAVTALQAPAVDTGAAQETTLTAPPVVTGAKSSKTTKTVSKTAAPSKSTAPKDVKKVKKTKSKQF